MNKKISIIAVVLVVLALVLWLSTMTPSQSGMGGEPDLTQNTENEAENISVVEKGPVGIASGAGTDYLVDRNGRTLYVRNADALANTTSIKTSCNAECEKTWLPYLFGPEEEGLKETADPLLSKLNLFTRSDGKQQYALGNQPLYRHESDSKLGDKNGNLGNDWMIATP